MGSRRTILAGNWKMHKTSAETAAFFDLSEQFTDRMGLASAPVGRVLRALRRRGAWAAQAMFGRSFFAVAPSPRARAAGIAYLQESGVAAVELEPAGRGARVLSRRRPPA